VADFNVGATPMSKHRESKTIMRYDYDGENLKTNAVSFLGYDRETGGHN
jgi:hypothetical protein